LTWLEVLRIGSGILAFGSIFYIPWLGETCELKLALFGMLGWLWVAIF